MRGLASQGVQSADCRTALLYLCFLIFIVVGGIASAEATKGLCGRPLETFALHSHVSWFLSLQGEIASAEATRGLSDRPLDPFGADTPMLLGLLRKFFSKCTGIASLHPHRFGSSVRISLIDMQYGSASWLRPCSSITCAVFCIAGKALRIRWLAWMTMFTPCAASSSSVVRL